MPKLITSGHKDGLNKDIEKLRKGGGIGLIFTKVYSNNFSFVGLTTLKTFMNFNVSLEEIILCIIIREVFQFNCHCLIPLDLREKQ